MPVSTPVPTRGVPQQGGLVQAGTREDVIRSQRVPSVADPKSAQSIGLNAFLDQVWDRASDHKRAIQQQLVTNLRARNSEYSPEKLAKIKEEGGTPIFMGITEVKCNHGESWLLDIFSASEWSWALQPTPVPDIVPQVREEVTRKVMETIQTRLQGGEQVTPQELSEMSEMIEETVKETVDDEVWDRAKGMERKIQDQFTEGGFHGAFEDFIQNLVALKAGIIKGPVIRNYNQLSWTEQDDGTFLPAVEELQRPEFTSISPFDFFPDPDSAEVDRGNLVERYKLTRSELVGLRDEPNYVAQEINAILEEFETVKPRLEVLSSEERDRRELEDKQTEIAEKDTDDQSKIRDSIEVHEFWVSAQGRILREHGLTKDAEGNPLADLDEYEINVMRVGTHIIFVEFNPDPLLRRPYSVSGWNSVPGSFWYRGVPERMVHLQQVCNAAARALLRNLGIASGPQVDVDSERLAPGEDLEAIYPLKIWQTRNPHNSSSRAINFFQPDSNVTELMGVYDRFAQLADDYTGIPAYAFGSDKVAGAGRTSSGLSMLMSNSAKGIKRVILDIDMKVMRTLVQRMFDWNMQFSEDPDIKGDMAIVTTGTVALMAKEQMSSRRMEFLNVTNNDLDIPLIGKQNRANLLREVGSTLEIEGKNIVKTPEEIRDLVREQESQEAQEAERMAQLEQERGQAELANITAQAQLRQAQAQREAAELQIEQQRLQIETTNAETARFKAEADAKAKLVMAEANQLKVSSEVAGQAFEKLSEVQNVNQT